MLELFDARMCELEPLSHYRLYELRVNGNEPQRPHAWVPEDTAAEDVREELERAVHHHYGHKAELTDFWNADYMLEGMGR